MSRPGSGRSSSSASTSSRRGGPRSSAAWAGSVARSRSRPATASRVMVASTDGVGTKTAIAAAIGRFDTIGIDLVAMCVDDVVCTGRRAAGVPRLRRRRPARPDGRRRARERCRRGLSRGRLRARRRRDGGAPRPHGGGRLRHRGHGHRRRRALPDHRRHRRAGRAMRSSASRRRASIRTGSRWSGRWSRNGTSISPSPTRCGCGERSAMRPRRRPWPARHRRRWRPSARSCSRRPGSTPGPSSTPGSPWWPPARTCTASRTSPAAACRGTCRGPCPTAWRRRLDPARWRMPSVMRLVGALGGMDDAGAARDVQRRTRAWSRS